MKAPTITALVLSCGTVAALVGMLLSSGPADNLFFGVALISLIWGVLGLRTENAK